MPYVTPQRFIQEYGLEDVAQLLADEQRLLTGELLQGALAVAGGGAWVGTPSADEQAAALAGLDRLNRRLATTANFMDGYLRSAVTLPIAVDDANASTLEDCNAALARCALADDTDNATERMDNCCKDWRVWLKDVQAGRVTLVTGGTGADAGGEVPGPRRVRYGQAASGFDWARFGAVGRL